MFARHKHGINQAAPDGTPTRYFFFLPGPTVEHLDTLSLMARVTSDSEHCNELGDARDPLTLRAALAYTLPRTDQPVSPVCICRMTLGIRIFHPPSCVAGCQRCPRLWGRSKGCGRPQLTGVGMLGGDFIITEVATRNFVACVSEYLRALLERRCFTGRKFESSEFSS